MTNKILTEIENWKLEAKLEDNSRYFYHTSLVDRLLSGSKSFVIGRKGTGKTAVSEYLTKTAHAKRFSKKLSFKNFPFADLYNLSNESYTPPNQYITLWKYLIYSTVAKLFIINENIDLGLRKKLKDVYEDDVDISLPRTIKRWIGTSINISILGNGLGSGKTNNFTDNTTPWIDRVDILEDLVLNNIDDCEYLIVFDELDEDYKDIIDDKNHKQYTSLLTSLFKAAQDVRSIFHEKGKNLFPIIFLRDDIYDIIQDPDKTKWNDLKLSIDWNESTIKDLLAFRILRAENPNSKTLTFDEAWGKIFTNKEVGYGTRKQKNMSSFKFITRSTQLRPRDYIRYIKACAENAINLNQLYINPKCIQKVDKSFSNYLRSELEDEIHGILPDIHNILNLFSHIRKQTLSIGEFKKAYEEAVKKNDVQDLNIEFILQILFHFSVIGNQPNQKNMNVFKYHTPEARFNHKENIIVHRGLFKALQII